MNIVERSKVILLEVGAAPVMYLMLALSVVSVAVMIERALFFFRVRENLQRLASQLGSALERDDTTSAKQLVAELRSAEAAIVAAGLARLERGPAAVEEAMSGASAVQRMRLERRLGFLGTLGSNAPFVGLLGTVIGIVQEIWLARGARITSLVIYLAMGWVALVAIAPLLAALGPSGFAWVAAGGAVYTAGIDFYLYDERFLHWHGIWHLFVLAGSAVHFTGIWLHLA